MIPTIQKRITVAEMAPHIHSFKPGENKVDKLVEWLSNWIILSLECGKIKPMDFLPSKADLACHIGISQGTMQNVFRIVEDRGLIESKQKIGTYIKDKREDSIEKLTSKRELAVETIKKYILDKSYVVGDIIPSSRNISASTGVSNTTTRLAISVLVTEGILKKTAKGFIITDLSFQAKKIETQTLVEKISENIKEYISKNLKPGDKLPSNEELTKLFHVSIKTIHDALKILAHDGIIYTRRGRYGTIVAGKSSEVYHYEKFEHAIREYILSNCKIGDKLPSIKALANNYNTSTKTIKKALDNLSSDGFLTFVRGRQGGTFVTDIPQASGEAYTWLALTSDYISGIQ